MGDQTSGLTRELVIKVEGAFDPIAGSAIRARLAEARRTGPVVLDFSHAREVSDLGLAVIGQGLVTDRVAVRFRGLSRRHERMLRYLGLEVVTETPPAQRAGPSSSA